MWQNKRYHNVQNVELPLHINFFRLKIVCKHAYYTFERRISLILEIIFKSDNKIPHYSVNNLQTKFNLW